MICRRCSRPGSRHRVTALHVSFPQDLIKLMLRDPSQPAGGRESVRGDSAELNSVTGSSAAFSFLAAAVAVSSDITLVSFNRFSGAQCIFCLDPATPNPAAFPHTGAVCGKCCRWIRDITIKCALIGRASTPKSSVSAFEPLKMSPNLVQPYRIIS